MYYSICVCIIPLNLLSFNLIFMTVIYFFLWPFDNLFYFDENKVYFLPKRFCYFAERKCGHIIL